MQLFAVSQAVKIDQGFGRFTEGVVRAYTPGANRLGMKGNYTIEVTGGVDCFGKPAVVGSVKTAVLHTNVVAA